MKKEEDMTDEEKLFFTDPFYGFFSICPTFCRKNIDKDFLGLRTSFVKKLRIIHVVYERLTKSLANLREIKFDRNNIEHIKLTVSIASDIEAFIYQIQSFLDISAKSTRYFFKAGIKKFQTFGDLIHYKKWMVLDEEFYQYLTDHMSWFEDFNKKRGDITHSFSLDVFWNESKKEERFGFAIYSFRKEGTEDLEKFIDETIGGLNDYLKFYVEHFGKRMLNKSPKA